MGPAYGLRLPVQNAAPRAPTKVNKDKTPNSEPEADAPNVSHLSTTLHTGCNVDTFIAEMLHNIYRLRMAKISRKLR
jgi:hypothetical protein